MPTSIDEALRRLRAADPARDAPLATWAGSPAQLRAAEPPTALDITLPAQRRRPGWALASVAAVGVVILSIALAVIGTRHSSDSGSTGATTSGPQSSGAPSSAAADDNQARARQLVAQLVADFPVLPHAKAHASAPVPVLTQPESVLGSDDLVTATRWWTAPGTIDAARAYYRSHVSAVLHPTGTSSGNQTEGISFGGSDRSFAVEIGVDVELTTTPSGVAVRVDAEAIWRRARPAAETINDPSAVTVTIVRPKAPTVRRTLDHSQAQQLANVVDALQVAPDELVSCPAEFGRTTDTLRFSTADGTVEVVAQLSGCQGVQFSVNGHKQPGLDDGDGTVDRALLALLRLPAHYGR